MVVAVGPTVVEPLAEVEVNVPGVIAMPVAPLVAQVRTAFPPELTLVGVAPKEVINGVALREFEAPVMPAQPACVQPTTSIMARP